MLDVLFYSREGQLTILILVLIVLIMAFLFTYFIRNMNKAANRTNKHDS
jgi:flagellar basal body-associated protein FliL